MWVRSWAALNASDEAPAVRPVCIGLSRLNLLGDRTVMDGQSGHVGQKVRVHLAGEA